MISKNLQGPALAAALIVIVSACESQPTATSETFESVITARDALIADLKQCTLKHGYDPFAAGLPETALAPNELPWRQCAYDAAHKYGQEHPAVSAQYQQLIAEDMQMTAAIQQGTMTRTQRRARVEELIAQIAAAEEEAKIKPSSAGKDATETVDGARQQYQLRNVVENARGFSN